MCHGVTRDMIPIMPSEIHWKLLLSLTRCEFQQWKIGNISLISADKEELELDHTKKNK